MLVYWMLTIEEMSLRKKGEAYEFIDVGKASGEKTPVQQPSYCDSISE